MAWDNNRDGRTHGRTYNPKAVCPLNFFEVGVGVGLKKRDCATSWPRFGELKTLNYLSIRCKLLRVGSVMLYEALHNADYKECSESLRKYNLSSVLK